MKIIVASVAGSCFGVRDALDALGRIESPQSFAIYGELVHNDVILHQLDTRGFHRISETERGVVPDEPNVVITAHGISQRRRQELTDAGKTLVDTTCPLVERVHRAAQDFSNAGAFVVVIGKRGHVEVEGITGDLESFAVVGEIAEVGKYAAVRIGIVCQTTFPCDEAAAIRRQIENCNPEAEVLWADTICQPTKDRQKALRDLMGQVDAMVVVGGRRSHNTQRLIDECRQQGMAAWHVEEASQIDPSWFDGFETVGLTGGTSTLPETLQQVHDRLTAIATARISVACFQQDAPQSPPSW